MASEIALACQKKGAYPLITLNTEDHWTRSLQEIPRSTLEALPAHCAAALRQTDAFIFMIGPRNPVDWSKIPTEKQELANIWFLESNKYLDSWRRIAQERRVRMLGIEHCLVTPKRAESFGLGYAEWREVMLAGCLVDQREIADRANLLAQTIRKAGKVRIQTPSGTSIEFKLNKREPIVGDSIVTIDDARKGAVKFLPSGFVEVAAGEDTAEGTVVYDAPILVRGKRSVQGLTLRFNDGKIVGYSARSGVEAFQDYMRSGQGDLDRFSFFGLGLNPGLKHGFTQDDKVLGGLTIGIGGNEDKGGKNQTIGNRHWWASMTEATLEIDERMIVFKDGKLLV